jgi:NADPH2:quinone reductase
VNVNAIVVPEYGDSSVMELRDVDPATPGPGEVRIDVEAAGVNWSDVNNRRGDYPDRTQPPFVPGCEVSGTVTRVGRNVDRWGPGDDVIAFLERGGYAETAVARADWLLPVPEGFDLATAAGVFVQGFTAHNVVREWGSVTGDDTVLVYAAAGGVGSMAVQIAAATGATVIGTASTDEKLSFAADCGADHVVNYETSAIPDAVDRVAPDGVDVVLDGVGGDPFYRSFDVLAHGGRVVVYGAASGDIPTVSTPRLYGTNTTLIGYNLHQGLLQIPDQVMAARDPLYEGLADGTVEPMRIERRPLSDASAVHEEMEARETSGKLVLEP